MFGGIVGLGGIVRRNTIRRDIVALLEVLDPLPDRLHLIVVFLRRAASVGI
jgi:hypothetical protein